MEEFAQTRGSDDLFEDDFTPFQDPASQAYESEPIEPTVPTQSIPEQYQEPPQTTSEARSPLHTSNASQTDIPDSSIDSTATTSTLPPPTQPRSRTPVRGDRHLTGGIAKPKLTEDELSAKLAAAKLNSAKRAEAHRLAEADEADFHAREAKVQVKRQEEGRARRVMDMERESNRLRKLGAKGGREWDENKEEPPPSDRGRGYRRGMNGGVAPRGGTTNGLYQDGIPDRGQREQRGGFELRGRGRGRGRGAGGRGTFQNSPQKEEQRLPDPEQDFPALPASSRPKGTKPLPPDKVAESPKATSGGASWADQVTEAQ